MDGSMRGSSRMATERERMLVDRARTDPNAFAQLYDFYLPRIFGYIHRRVQERTVAEDLTATTFERALDALRRGSLRNDAFGAWLYRVATNAVIDDARRTKRVSTFDPQRDGRVGDPRPDLFAAAIERDELRRAITRLPAGHRRVLLLRFFDDLDADEAGAVLGCSRRTFAVKLHRALVALRRALAQEATNAA